MLSTALNSNAINVTAGLLIPASLVGLGATSEQDLLVTAWYAGLTVLALALAWHGRGPGRLPGALIIVGYLAFAATLAVSVGRQAVSPVTAVVPAVVIGTAGAMLVTWPACDETTGSLWRRDSLLPGVEHRAAAGTHPHGLLGGRRLRHGQRMTSRPVPPSRPARPPAAAPAGAARAAPPDRTRGAAPALGRERRGRSRLRRYRARHGQ